VNIDLFGVQVDHRQVPAREDKLSMKGAWSRSRDLFTFWETLDNISEMVQDT